MTRTWMKALLEREVKIIFSHYKYLSIFKIIFFFLSFLSLFFQSIFLNFFQLFTLLLKIGYIRAFFDPSIFLKSYPIASTPEIDKNSETIPQFNSYTYFYNFSGLFFNTVCIEFGKRSKFFKTLHVVSINTLHDFSRTL